MTKSLAAVLLATLATTASAENVVATGEVDHAAPRYFDARLGALLGGADVGDTAGFSAGISGGVGYRVGDVTLRALLDYYKVGDSSSAPMPRLGRATRAGGAVRYSFANLGQSSNAIVDFWGELGAGYEYVAWRTGGVLDRPSGEVAFGLDVGGRGERDANGRRHAIGYFMAFRSFVGERPDMHAAPTCGGPCTEATTPPRTDVSMFFDFGIHWGR